MEQVKENPNNNSMILQDFLATPPPPQSPTTAVAATTTNDPSSVLDSTFFGPLTPPPPPPPATLLSLNSGSNNFHQFHMRHLNNNPSSLQLHSAIISSTFGSVPLLSHAFGDASSPPSSIFPSFCKKRAQEIEDKPVDRRHKRIIKNRESAARSRARKQAYVNELELEVAHLQEENARLRKLQERVLVVCENNPKKHTLTRSLTAPF